MCSISNIGHAPYQGVFKEIKSQFLQWQLRINQLRLQQLFMLPHNRILFIRERGGINSVLIAILASSDVFAQTALWNKLALSGVWDWILLLNNGNNGNCL